MNQAHPGATPGLAATPEAPYYAVIFTSQRTPVDAGYSAMAERMVEAAARQPGFLGIESCRSPEGMGGREGLDTLRNGFVGVHGEQGHGYRRPEGRGAFCGLRKSIGQRLRWIVIGCRAAGLGWV